MPSPKTRTSNIPADAVWNEDDTCWEHGPTTATGERHGAWRSWYASGTERGVASFEDGVLHGTEVVRTGAGDETPFDDSFAKNVSRAEFVYERGVLLRQRCFAHDGAEVGSDGEALPDRPEGVPSDASYVAPAELWVHGPMLGGAPMTGRQRMWDLHGELLSDIGWKDGAHHGTLNIWRGGETILEEDGAPVGPPRTTRVQAEYVEGELRSARFFGEVAEQDEDAVERELAAATFEGGKLHGPLRWLTHWHMSFSRPVVAVEALGIDLQPSTLFEPRRLPGTYRIEADFDHGSIKAVRAFDKRDKLIVPPPPVTRWGQDTTTEQLAGYLASGAFAGDVADFFGDAECTSQIDEDAARAEGVFARLPEPHKAAAFAFDRFVRSGAMPSMQTFQLYGYGFDCVKNELYDAEDERYFGLGYDGFGDMYLLDVDTGRVRRWGHDRDPWEDGAEFASLDAFAFGLLRNELVAQRRIDRTEMDRCFARLGFGWLAPL